jgi:hypothetical protein
MHVTVASAARTPHAYVAAKCNKGTQRVCLVLVLGCGCSMLGDHVAKLLKVNLPTVVLVNLHGSLVQASFKHHYSLT